MYYAKKKQAIEYIILANALVFFLTIIMPGVLGALMPLQPATLFSRPWTLITSMFIHADLNHILFNMISLFFFGTYLEQVIGQKDFLKVYFLGGLAAGLMFAAISLTLGIPDPRSIALGASGAISAVMGALIILRPNLTIYLYFLFPMPLWVWGIVFIIAESLYTPSMSGVAHSAHLGGILAGLIFGYYFKRKGGHEQPAVSYSYKYGY